MAKGANFPVIAAINETLLLDVLRRAPAGLSRVEMARETELSAQAVSNVSRRLIDRGLLREVGNRAVRGPGKPATILQLDAAGAYAIGVHLDPSVLTCVLLDLRAQVVARTRRRPPQSGDAGDTVELVTEAITELLAASGVHRDRIVGIGVAGPGPIDAEAGVLVRPRLAPGWTGFHLPDRLHEAFGLPTTLTKDVTAAVLAEEWTNPISERQNTAFIYWGTGVGVGLVLDGAVHAGSSQNAGDVGHSVVDPTGPQCVCGRRGCFGEVMRPYRLVIDALQRGAIPMPPELAGRAVDDDVPIRLETVDSLFHILGQSAALGNEAALAVLDRAGQSLALYVANLIALLDIDQVVFGGPSWPAVQEHMMKSIAPLLAAAAEASGTQPVALVSSSIGDDVAAVGAASLVMERNFSPRYTLR
ncbi:ROK family transcriptional regulator [Glaciibacter psychrotolerans]|uniref:Putative NBD/HSP70 family sugar kinase n=1 Tax=Glaciibacter psychrotolerans TaxID=670054 RepID=A0A7Z0EBE9_9MICO|nr:ROK family transcriptional regulator [Leifsonia psychrotolerans]NYJ18558.1 putative NBD/HSP70 family sugar kinase [Leifsonia psychrotolerans]